MKTDRQSLGSKGEDLAVKFLRQKGFRVLYRNYRIGKAEIDIIALDENDLIMTEVKSVYTLGCGYAEEHINRKKKLMLIRAAYKIFDLLPALAGKNIRFDVVVINFDKYPATIRHYPGAFWQQSADLR